MEVDELRQEHNEMASMKAIPAQLAHHTTGLRRQQGPCGAVVEMDTTIVPGQALHSDSRT
ncbi:hypothetical protein E2C01_065083 [Portunus trituberculatus]|uniref:Uncharacterized protein n=1 Tax=Portunus trituberculatus TaxID=210409 RepID=A0A5B7HKX8_PORTR|nr:hypothetical protein [Portunus trituberculatus]